MCDRLEVFKSCLELLVHALVNQPILLLRLEDPAELNPLGNIFQIDQAQVVEGQKSYADNIIVAIGQSIAADWLDGLIREKGYIKVNGNFQTSVDSIFAGGDMIGGEGTIVQSVANGKHAAQAIHGFLSGKKEAARGL